MNDDDYPDFDEYRPPYAAAIIICFAVAAIAAGFFIAAAFG